MKNKILGNDIKTLDLSKKIIEILYENNIHFIGDVWNLKRSDLKNMNLSNDQINFIIVRLQLIGLDLNRKIY